MTDRSIHPTHPVCLLCRHFRPDEAITCDAFPGRIPDLVWLEGDPHNRPIPGDHGIRFEPISSLQEISHGPQGR